MTVNKKFAVCDGGGPHESVEKRGLSWPKQQLKFHTGRNFSERTSRMYVPDTSRPCSLRSPPFLQELTARVRSRDHDCFPR